MSRTITEVPLKTNNVDQVLNIISAKMKASGYQEKIVDDETVWAKGDGVMIKMQCLSAVFTGKSVIIQGWMKDVVTGESNLEGLAAILPKKKLKKIINEICIAITSKNL